MTGRRAEPGNPDDWNAERYAHSAAFVPGMAADLVDWLQPRAGEAILDLGCGEGSLTRRLVDAGARVLGLDASASMVARARDAGLDAVCLDAAEMDFESEFDAVFSNAALHWMRDLPAVLTRVALALKPGGRLVAEMGGAGNLAQLRTALECELAAIGLDAGRLDPWVFPDCRRIRAWLEQAGLQPGECTLFARPTPLPGALGDWLEVFAPAYLAPLDGPGRRRLIYALERRLRPQLWRPDDGWVLDYVRLRFAATRSSS